MVFFNLYLGIMGLLTIYTLIDGLRKKEIESLIVATVCLVMFGGVFALKAFDLYIPLLAYFLFVGIVMFVVSDFGLLTLEPNPWGSLIKSFPTYTGSVGLISLLAVVELWIEYDKYWTIFGFIFVALMTIAFFTAFYRVIRWTRAGLIICATLIFAGILYYIHTNWYFRLNEYVVYWVMSVIVQSTILLIWRLGVRIGIASMPERLKE